MNIDMYAFSSKGAILCDKIIEGLKDDNIEAFVPERYIKNSHHVKMREDNLYNSIEKSFKEKNCIIFIGAVGIAVRAISPFVKSKTTDPAVICVDERGLNVISLLSGHIGGANKLTREISIIVGGNPIITTATDINDKFAVDEWASNKNMHIGSLKSCRDIASEILEDNKIGLYCDFSIEGEIPAEIDKYESNIGICISLNDSKKPFYNTLNLIPRIISIGVGCRKGTEFNIIYNAIKDVLLENNISHCAIKSINSIDLKKDEEGIIKVSEILNVPFNTFSKEELNKIEGQFSKSKFVESIAGVDTVCERAALMESNNNTLIIKKTINNSVTVAASMENYTVSFDYK